MTEQTTQTDEAVAEAVAETTGTGLPGERKMKDRMAIYARSEHGNQAEVDLDREHHPSVDAVAASIESDTVIENADADGADDVTTVSEDQVLRDQGTDEVVETPGGGTGARDETAVDLKVFGRNVQLPKWKVDELGGIAASQLILSADHRMRQATEFANSARELQTRAQARLADVERLERELKERSSAAGTPSGQQSGSTTHAAPTDDALRAKVKATVDVMFKGDAEGAEKALTEVLAMIPRNGNQPSAEELSSLVLAKVEAGLLQGQIERQRKEQEQLVANEAADVNALMKTKYKAINDDPILQSMARGLFASHQRDPRNKGRSLVAIADDVGNYMVAHVLGGSAPENETVAAEVKARVNLKRRIPAASQTSERASTSEQAPAFPTSGKDIVNLLRASRGQTPL